MKKKLLFITSRLLWPIDGGRKMSLNYYCKGLHEQFGYDIYLYCFLESGQRYDGVHPDYIREVYIAEEVRTGDKIYNLFAKTLLLEKWPVQCSLYYSKANCKKIKDLCDRIKPMVVFTEMIRTAIYFDSFAGNEVKTVANLDDLLSKRYLRQAAARQSKANMAGAYSGKLPGIINQIITNPILKRRFLKYEAKHCEIWERKFYSLYDHVMFTSQMETKEINENMHNNKALTLSVGIDYDLFASKIETDIKEPDSMSYVGNFNVATNIDTLKMICENILPHIKHNYKFYIIGSCPEEFQKKYASERIIFTGRVEDLVGNVKKTKIFLSPILYGTGVKTKIVEAMAMGMPIVTNSVGAEGIDACSGKEFIVENEYRKIAEAVDSLFQNEKLMKELGKAAQNFAYKYFRWEVVYKCFESAGL